MEIWKKLIKLLSGKIGCREVDICGLLQEQTGEGSDHSKTYKCMVIFSNRNFRLGEAEITPFLLDKKLRVID